MSVLLTLWGVSLGLVVGALVERRRWLAWAHKHHPDEVDTTWL